MANTNPQAVRIVNDIIRPNCDRYAGLTAALTLTLEHGSVQDWMSLFPDDDEVIADGSDLDGRKPLTNRQVRLIIGATRAYLGFAATPLGDGLPTPQQAALLAAVNPR